MKKGVYNTYPPFIMLILNERGEAIVVKKLQPLFIEAIVRGYIIGSGWKDYQRTGTICGIRLPDGLQLAKKLPEPIFTPSTKAAVGHDQDIDFQEVVVIVGEEYAERIRDISLSIFKDASQYAENRGILIADTRFEFGIDKWGHLYLIDEVLTPDSSRYWNAEKYQVGTSPESFDKQIIRDYLESIAWNKDPPAPSLPQEIVEKTPQRYQEVQQRLVKSN
jgi:phosphoribosylaminoimidazole-succinocarboxamide synthase